MGSYFRALELNGTRSHPIRRHVRVIMSMKSGRVPGRGLSCAALGFCFGHIKKATTSENHHHDGRLGERGGQYLNTGCSDCYCRPLCIG